MAAAPAEAEVAFAPAAGMRAFFVELMGLPSLNPLGLVRVVQRYPEAVRLAAPYAQVAAVLGWFVARRAKRGT